MWNTSENEPFYYPESGEPEDYILEKPHDPVSADQMGNLWELIAPEFQTISEISDWARLSSNGWLIVSEKTKILLEGKVAQWVRFQLVPTE